MDRLTKVLVDSKMKSLQRRGSKSVENVVDPSSFINMVTNTNRDIEEEKRRRREKHLKEEKKREEMRNKYRQKYGLDKDRKKGFIKERNCYVMDSTSGKAIGVHKRVAAPGPSRRLTVESSNPSRTPKSLGASKRPNSVIGLSLPMPRFYNIEIDLETDGFENEVKNISPREMGQKEFGNQTKNLSPRTSAQRSEKESAQDEVPVPAEKKDVRWMAEVNSRKISDKTSGIASSVFRKRIHSLNVPLSSEDYRSIHESQFNAEPQSRSQPVGIDLSHKMSEITLDDENHSASDSPKASDESENENTETSTWENNAVVRFFLAPLLNRKTKSLSDIFSWGESRRTEEMVIRDILDPVEDSCFEEQSSQNIPDEYDKVFIDEDDRSLSCSLDFRKDFQRNDGYQSRSDSLYTLSRKNSFISVRSSATALSDPLAHLPRDRQGSIDGLSTADTSPESIPSTSIRKRGFRHFLRSLRRSKNSMKCVRMAAQAPVHGDHSLLPGNEVMEAEKINAASTAGQSSYNLHDDEARPRRKDRHKSTDSNKGEDNVDSRPTLSVSTEAAKRAEYIYYKYMSQIRKP